MAVALDIDIDLINKMYKDEGAKIFKRGFLSGLRKGGRYSTKNLHRNLEEIFGTRKLGDAKCDVAIASTSLDNYGHRIFTNMNGGNDPDLALLAKDIVAASSSAPTYFDPTKPSGSERSYIDGGLWGNSPAFAGLLTAHRIKKIPFESVHLLSIGNGKAAKGISLEEYSKLRTISTKTISNIFDIMFSSQESFFDNNASLFVDHSKLIVVNAHLDKGIALDNHKDATSKLPALAQGVAEDTASRFHELFVESPDLSVLETADSPASPRLISRELVKACGLTGFFPSRSYYGTHRPSAASIAQYIATAKSEVVMISVNLATGIPFENFIDTIKARLTDKEKPLDKVTISLLNPKKNNLMSSIAPVLDIAPTVLCKSIKNSLGRLLSFRSSLPEGDREKFEIRVHNSLPFGSAIMLDAHEIYGRIQVETKPYKAAFNSSFAFEVMRTSQKDNLYTALLDGFLQLIQDGQHITSASDFK